MGLPLVLDFTWTAPASCPTREEVVSQLSRAVDAEAKELPRLTAQAIVTRDGAVWRLELTTDVDGRGGTRHLEAESCEGLARASTLVLALALGEGLARRQALAETAAPPSPPPPSPSPPAAPPPRAAPASRPAPLRSVELTWAVGFGSDPLGTFGPLLELGGAYRWGWFSVGLRAAAWLPRTKDIDGSGPEVKAHGVNGDLELCLTPDMRALLLAACGGAGWWWMHAQGRDTDSDRRVDIPLYATGPSVRAGWFLGQHGFVHAGAGGRFFLERPDLIVEGLAARRSVVVAALRLDLGGGVRW